MLGRTSHVSGRRIQSLLILSISCLYTVDHDTVFAVCVFFVDNGCRIFASCIVGPVNSVVVCILAVMRYKIISTVCTFETEYISGCANHIFIDILHIFFYRICAVNTDAVTCHCTGRWFADCNTMAYLRLLGRIVSKFCRKYNRSIFKCISIYAFSIRKIVSYGLHRSLYLYGISALHIDNIISLLSCCICVSFFSFIIKIFRSFYKRTIYPYFHGIALICYPVRDTQCQFDVGFFCIIDCFHFDNRFFGFNSLNAGCLCQFYIFIFPGNVGA